MRFWRISFLVSVSMAIIFLQSLVCAKSSSGIVLNVEPAPGTINEIVGVSAKNKEELVLYLVLNSKKRIYEYVLEITFAAGDTSEPVSIKYKTYADIPSS